ncbi:MAG: type II toxin-antitoxin system HipA family toxin [Rhodospirillales bacterium]|jgi:serine/threonine-protein kinase HipA|nr:type II toxin-antitoxin system HipA family toxin [Rhodospirillales bacterium]
MTTVAEVRLWGTSIGAVSIDSGTAAATAVADFEYDSSFLASGIQVSPIAMPLPSSPAHVYSFGNLSPQSFHGLPGLLADSLPDKFGNALIDAWLATQGRLPESFDAVERLCYTGTRGMGALEFTPALGPKPRKSKKIKIDALVDLASEVLSHRNDLQVTFADKDKEDSLKEILRVGTSAGGARAKAIIAWNEKTNEVRSGQIDVPPEFSYWLLKFDGVKDNKDKEIADPEGFGAIEYAYYKMAEKAGIKMNECRLMEENGRRHFMTRRFDRLMNGEKLHMQSLGGMAHFDFNMAGAYSYEQAFLVMRQLGLPLSDIEEQFRRMVFNIVARNQDDHVKNIAFLMNQAGQWSLSPAYDLTYSYNSKGDWTNKHQMSLNNKRDNFTIEDLRAVAKGASMKRGLADSIYDQVKDAVRQWETIASDIDVMPEWITQISNNLRLSFADDDS